jgi:uncharacterized protein YqjF (DUF2071 family)
MSWIIEQRWNHVLFLNWKVDPALIQPHVPFPLDLHEGKAVLSIVPFLMDRIRFPFTPVVPGLSSLWELNLRTYVKVNGIPGVYFFCLDTPNLLGNWIAQKFFRLPYRSSKIESSVQKSEYKFQSIGKDYRLTINANLLSESSNDPFQKWVTERYHLFLEKNGKTWRGDVIHEPWSVQQAKLNVIKGEFTQQIGQELPPQFDSIYYAKQIYVRFKPFRNLSKTPLNLLIN